VAAMRDGLHRSREPWLSVILVSLLFVYSWLIIMFDLGVNGNGSMTALISR